MKKVIVKSRLDSKGLFIRQARTLGLEFSPAIWQHERIYTAPNFRPGQNFPRLILRTEVKATNQSAEYSLFLKRHIEDSGVDYINQTGITDYTEMTGIIHQLGYNKMAEVARQRLVADLDDHTKIFLDNIEGIDGTFIKIEANLEEGTSVNGLRKDILQTLQVFDQETYTTQTYAELLAGKAEEQQSTQV